MAGRGPAPKPSGQQRRRNAESKTTKIEVERVDAPELPGADRFSQLTVRWYETWRGSPQSVRFVATDWQRLHMLAPLVDRYFREPSAGLMTEIRLNESLLGATDADRLRLRVELTAPEGRDAAGPKSRESRRGLVVHEGGAAAG